MNRLGLLAVVLVLGFCGVAEATGVGNAVPADSAWCDGCAVTPLVAAPGPASWHSPPIRESSTGSTAVWVKVSIGNHGLRDFAFRDGTCAYHYRGRGLDFRASCAGHRIAATYQTLNGRDIPFRVHWKFGDGIAPIVFGG